MATTTVYLNSAANPPIVHAVQNDTDRSLKIVIVDDTLASGMTGKLYFIRPDNTYYYANGTLVLADNAFTVDIKQALTRYGKVYAQLKITRSGNVVSSRHFIIDVERSANAALASQLGYSIDDMKEWYDMAINAAERADAAATLTERGYEVVFIEDQDYKLVIR